SEQTRTLLPGIRARGRPVVDAEGVEPRVVRPLHPPLEAGDVAVVRRWQLRPGHLGEGSEPGEELVVEALLGLHALRPHIGLRSEYPFLGRGAGQVRWNGLEAVDVA